jgi:hypothetical protein
LTSSRSFSVLLIYPPQNHDLTVCVIPIVLASSLARWSRTIRPHVENSLSTSADIGRTESTSRASWGLLLRGKDGPGKATEQPAYWPIFI